jgi:hypothetical protein
MPPYVRGVAVGAGLAARVISSRHFNIIAMQTSQNPAESTGMPRDLRDRHGRVRHFAMVRHRSAP